MFATGHYDIIDALLVGRKMGWGYMEDVRMRYGEEGGPATAFQALSRMYLMMNPPKHTRLRAPSVKAFCAKQIELLRTVSQAVAGELIDAIPKCRPFDLCVKVRDAVPGEDHVPAA
jgi:cytochrome P450